MARAMLSGVFLYCSVMLASAFSLALIQYYPRYDFILLFPLFGILSLFWGEYLLRCMERDLGFKEGGADATLVRSLFAAGVVWIAATGGLGVMMTLSHGILNLFNLAEVPRYLPIIEQNNGLNILVK